MVVNPNIFYITIRRFQLGHDCEILLSLMASKDSIKWSLNSNKLLLKNDVLKFILFLLVTKHLYNLVWFSSSFFIVLILTLKLVLSLAMNFFLLFFFTMKFEFLYQIFPNSCNLWGLLQLNWLGQIKEWEWC